MQKPAMLENQYKINFTIHMYALSVIKIKLEEHLSSIILTSHPFFNQLSIEN